MFMSKHLLSMNLVLLLSALVVLLCVAVSRSEIPNVSDPIVYTQSGIVRGRQRLTLFNRKPYNSFEGIPYAKPPIGELRFKAPQPAEPWTDIFDASAFGTVCIQSSGRGGGEDCLSLNVYVPVTVNIPIANLPVVVGIHGGGFHSGLSSSLGPDLLLNQDNLIIVTVNYRVGPLGFLSLNTPEYSGNMGLKDQLLAIKWVNDNIRNFGGDTNRITLYGISAGSTSVHLHVLSPASQGLFQRAILASGSVYNIWSDDDHLPTLFEFAERNGNTVQNIDQLSEYLKVLDPYVLVEQTFRRVFTQGSGRLAIDMFWGPRTEPADAIEPFMVVSPFDILENNFQTDVDLLFGYVSAESYNLIGEEMANTSMLQAFDEVFEFRLPIPRLNDGLDYQSENYLRLKSQVREFYFGHNDGRVNSSSLLEYTKMLSDISFVYGIDRAVKVHANSLSSGRTFYYRFSTIGRYNVFRLATSADCLGLPGATHNDDTHYAFATEGQFSDMYNRVPANSMERRVVNEFSRFYTNFIVYGSPTLEGDRVQLDTVRPDQINYADFTNERFAVDRDPFGINMLFWDELIDQHFT